MNVPEDGIYVCGFSAGGHLAACLGAHWNKKYVAEALKIKCEMSAPNGLILCYPVILYGQYMHKVSFYNLLGNDAKEHLFNEMSLEKHVGSHTPPVFLWHTLCDESVPVENSLLFACALREKGIPFEMHIFPKGNHGLSLAIEETAEEDCQINVHVACWTHLCFDWMDQLSMSEK